MGLLLKLVQNWVLNETFLGVNPKFIGVIAALFYLLPVCLDRLALLLLLESVLCSVGSAAGSIGITI